MSGMLQIDDRMLSERGFVLLPELVDRAAIDEAERVLEVFCERQLAQRKIKQRHCDPLIDILTADENYRAFLFPLLRNFFFIQKMTADFGNRLKDEGFLDRHGFDAPMIWPFVRFDLPDETTYLLDFHQDRRSTTCRRAFRLWLPLRDVDRNRGSMELFPGSHKTGWLPARDDGMLPDETLAAMDFDGEPECITMPAGCGLLFDPLVVHRSVLNRSDRVKIVVMVQIQDAGELIAPAAS